MKVAQHWLVGYDRQTELEAFELPIPQGVFRDVREVVSFDADDPEAIGSYKLTDQQARQIAKMVRRENLLRAGLDFFLEAYSKAS
jgi:hypothetical protein